MRTLSLAYHVRLSFPNEEIQLDQSQKTTVGAFCCRWPAASFFTSTDGETLIKFLKQYLQLNSIPETSRTDNATAFTGRLFRDFFKKHYFKIIYGTPYIQTPTGLVERIVRTLKENYLTIIKAGEQFGKALEMSLM